MVEAFFLLCSTMLKVQYIVVHRRGLQFSKRDGIKTEIDTGVCKEISFYFLLNVLKSSIKNLEKLLKHMTKLKISSKNHTGHKKPDCYADSKFNNMGSKYVFKSSA